MHDHLPPDSPIPIPVPPNYLGDVLLDDVRASIARGESYLPTVLPSVIGSFLHLTYHPTNAIAKIGVLVRSSSPSLPQAVASLSYDELLHLLNLSMYGAGCAQLAWSRHILRSLTNEPPAPRDPDDSTPQAPPTPPTPDV